MELRILRQIRERALRGKAGVRQFVSADGSAAAIGSRETGKNFHRRALAGAVRTDEQGELPGFNTQRQAAKHDLAAVGFLQVVGDNHLTVSACVVVVRRCAARCARMFQNRLVSGDGSSIELTPGSAARCWAKRSSLTAGLSERNATAGKSRRRTPKRSSSRCGRSFTPSWSRSNSVAPSQRLPTPSTAHLFPLPSATPGLDRVEIAREDVFGETIVVRVRAEFQADVISA